jgi:hypothetical protein
MEYGLMHDTLVYFSEGPDSSQMAPERFDLRDDLPEFRKIIQVSPNEVVHGKGSMIIENGLMVLWPTRPRPCEPSMRSSGFGRVRNACSWARKLGQSNEWAYDASL